jgi:hypothetical protein
MLACASMGAPAKGSWPWLSPRVGYLAKPREGLPGLPKLRLGPPLVPAQEGSHDLHHPGQGRKGLLPVQQGEAQPPGQHVHGLSGELLAHRPHHLPLQVREAGKEGPLPQGQHLPRQGAVGLVKVPGHRLGEGKRGPLPRP